MNKKVLGWAIGGLLVIVAGVILLIESLNKPDYNMPVIGQPYPGTVACVSVPLNDSIQKQIDSGFLHVQPQAGNALYCENILTVSFTAYQRWKSNHHGYLWAALIVALVGLGSYAYLTSTGAGLWTMAIIVVTFFVGGLLISGYYYFNPERQIKKRDYTHYIQKDGDLRNFPIDPAQTY